MTESTGVDVRRLNLMARVDENPGMMCSFDNFHERPYKRPVLPCMMPGRHKHKWVPTKEEPWFHLDFGNDYASD